VLWQNDSGEAAIWELNGTAVIARLGAEDILFVPEAS
jgi:hypothetical protein